MIFVVINQKEEKLIIIFGDWGLGMGIGDWGLGIGDWGLGPIPNPQSPIPISTKKSLCIISINNKI